jgi:hypothetical protein
MTDWDAWRTSRQEALVIENPLAECGHCGFGTMLHGAWSVEDGRLVFRADPNPLRSRGPDYESCGESSTVARFSRIAVDGEALTDEQVAALQATARTADEAEFGDD